MPWTILTDGVVTESGDDATRTVTYADGSTRPCTDAENAEADRQQAQAAMLDSLEERVARIEAHLWPPDAEPPADTSSVQTWPGVLYPGQTYREADGRIVRNITSVPLTTPMSGMPGGGVAWIGQLWEVLTGAPVEPDPPAGVPEWSATAEYKPGDLVTRGGVTYRCLVAHGAAYAGTWGPPTVGVWVVA